MGYVGKIVFQRLNFVNGFNDKSFELEGHRGKAPKWSLSMLQWENKISLTFEWNQKMKRTFVLLAIVFSLLLAACGQEATPDPCSPENLPLEAAKVNKLMREFDDYSALASNTLQNQLVVLIPEMQRILREAEDLPVPACLETLKDLQMAHMNLVIQTLMAFMNNTDVQLINAGITQARELHGKYDVEMARLLGVTLAPQPTSLPRPTATPAANVVPSPATQVAMVTNAGLSGINLRSAPGLNAPESGILNAQTSTTALGRSADDQWILVEIPAQPGLTAWVYAALVQLSVPIAQLPVVNQ
jgi:hypothetical protein